jgi:hypothetical protein
MEEFLKFLQEMMDAGKEKVRGINLEGTIYALGLGEDTTEEGRRVLAESVKEEEGVVGEIVELKYPCEALQEGKEAFNEDLEEILDKYDLTPEHLGLNYSEFGFIFIFNTHNSHYEEIRDALVDLVSRSGRRQRVILVHDSEHQIFETDMQGNCSEPYKKDKPSIPMSSGPKNRRPISESEIVDLKIALNREAQRDCLEILEDIMKIGC